MAQLSFQQLRRRASLAKWAKLDWTKQDCELADEMDLSRERIRVIRKQFGAPKSTHHRRLRKTAAVLQWAKANLDKIKGLSGAEVGRKYNLSGNWRTGLLREYLQPVLRDGRRIRKHPWDLMNFRLPDRDLERIWRLPHGMAASYRHRHQRPPSPWRFKPRTGDSLCRQRQLQAHQLAVKAEERNAARYFAQA